MDRQRLKKVVAELSRILNNMALDTSNPEPPNKDHQLLELIKQLKEKTLNFTFYFLSGKDFKTTNTDLRKLSGPVVTVALAKIKGGFARGVGVCHPKDTPNKRGGKIAAAKALLHALKKGQCFADPINPLVSAIMGVLYNSKIVSFTDTEDILFIVGTKRAKLTPEEKKIAAGFNQEKKIKHFTCVAKHWHVVETVRCETLKEAQEYIRIWKDLSPEDRGAIETLKDNLS